MSSTETASDPMATNIFANQMLGISNGRLFTTFFLFCFHGCRTSESKKETAFRESEIPVPYVMSRILEGDQKECSK